MTHRTSAFKLERPFIAQHSFAHPHSISPTMSAAGAAAKRLLERAPKAVRTFKSSAVQQSGGHGHSTGGYDDYIHAEHMYSIQKMPHRKIKMAIACSSIVILGFGIPATAIQWQKHKAAG